MQKIELPLTDLDQVYSPGELLLVSAGAQLERACVMPVSLHTRMQLQPERLVLILRRESRILAALLGERACVLNLPVVSQLTTCLQQAALSGMQAAQMQSLGWRLEPALSVRACSVLDCRAHIECRLEQHEVVGEFVICTLEPQTITADADWAITVEGCSARVPVPYAGELVRAASPAGSAVRQQAGC